MVHQCETCGQSLDDEGHSHATWIGEDAPPTDAHVPDTPASGSRDRRILLAIAGLAVAWLAVVGLGRLAAPDEVAEIPYAPTAVPTAAAIPTLEPAPDMSNEVIGDPSIDPVTGEHVGLQVPAQDVDVTQLGSRSGATVQVERLVRQLGRRGSDLLLAYRAADGVVVVDLSAGTASLIEPTTDQVLLAPQYSLPRTAVDTYTIDLNPFDVLLRGGGQTFAIDPVTQDVRLIADDASLVTAQTTEGPMYWVPGRDLQGQAAEVIALSDGIAEWFRAPHARQLVIADGLGLLAVAKGPEGGTLIAQAGDFAPISDHRVLDANTNALLEQACDQAEPCRFLVRDLATDEVWRVPDGFIDTRDRFKLSPDGTAVLRHTPDGFAEIYDADDQNVAWVTGASMHDAAWSPDSSFVTWIDLLGAPELRVMFLDERDWLNINLLDLGVPRPISGELVVFMRPGDPETS